ncbi:MAG TPA: hypothetical protein VM509_08575, partial [Planctomycetota bacterium]|nr:hypothetical protein [Planctomycetota bacterium]
MSNPSPQPERRPRKKRRLFLGLLVTFVVSALLLEGTLRILAYSEYRFAKRLRAPTHYADRWSDPFYFQLAQLWAKEPGKLQPRISDPRLGWVNDGMDHDQFVDPGEKNLGDRRPVLLFGDSYVRCMTDAENCFEGWMQRSEHATTHAIFNYGVRAYGIDQIALLARFTLEHWRARNPIVAIGIYVEDDLDRAYLDFRGWPKPRFRLDEVGALREPEKIPTPEEYEAANPLWKHSLAWG